MTEEEARAPEAPETSGSWVKRIVLSVLGLLVLGEVVLRIAFADSFLVNERPGIYRLDDGLGYRYVPGAEGSFQVPSVNTDVRINERGYCGETFQEAKAEGVYRVAFVGSTDTTGLWLDDEDAYPKRLEALSSSVGRKIEILDFSVDGKNRGLARLRQVESEVLRYKPNMVVLYLEFPFPSHVPYRESYSGYVVETGDSRLSQTEREERRERILEFVDDVEGSFSTTLYDLSYLVRGLQAAMGEATPMTTVADLDAAGFAERIHAHRTRRVSLVDAPELIPPPASLERLLETRKRVQEAGAVLLVYQYQNDARLRALLEENKINHVFLGLGGDAELRNEVGGRLTSRGHEAVAKKLFEALSRT